MKKKNFVKVHEEKKKIREERLALYAAKKDKKPVLIAKSCIKMDVKVWDDETDLKALEEKIKAIEMPGLLWGQCKCSLSLSLSLR